MRSSPPPVQTPPSAGESSLLHELTSRGLSQGHARRILQSLPEGQSVLDQLEYGDWMIANSRKGILNPPGFYTYLLRENVIPPQSFETSSKRSLRTAAEHTRNTENRLRLELEQQYKEFCEELVRIYIEMTMDRSCYEERLREKFREVRSTWPRLPESSIKEISERALRADLRTEASLPSFDDFCHQHRQRLLFEQK
jgi:hypothetical protein